MLVFGTKVIYRVVGECMVHCERCGGDRPFGRRAGRRWVHLLGVPLYPFAATADHLRCTICRTCYRMELLGVPTVAQMQAALAEGTRAAVLAMLRAGDPASRAARRLAVARVRRAGSPEYGEQSLTADLAATGRSWGSPGLRRAVEALAFQLEPHAREWFLSEVVQVGLADGSLSPREREAIGAIAGHLGMSRSRADDVILLTEAAQAG
jgi:tellurite resistance protein